ncbi:MAG: GAF domain-containing protein [Gammaproteobacteria bacterium]|nr:GAF domain-containing protein [Gammaproteobacteria bacterium]
MGEPRDGACGTPCSSVVGGQDDFGRAVCGAACPALKALAAGNLTGTSRMLAPAVDGTLRRLACDLIALPSGGALGRLREGEGASADPAHDLAGIAALTARVAGEPLQQGLRDALDFLVHATVADAAEAFLTEPHGRGMVRTCHRGRFGRAFDQVLRFDPGAGFPGLVLRHGQAVYSDHLPDDPRFLRSQVKRAGFHHYICAPLSKRGDELGCIALGFRRPSIDREHVLNLLRWVGTPLGLVVDAALTHLQLSAALPLRGLEDNPECRLPQALHELLQEMVRVGHADGGDLSLPWYESRLRRSVIGRSTVPRCPMLSAETIDRCPAFARGTTQLMHGRRDAWPQRCRDAPHPGGAWCCIPVVCDGESLGVIRLQYRHLRPSPPNESLAVLEGLAALAAERVRQAYRQLARIPTVEAVSVTRQPRSAAARAAVAGARSSPQLPEVPVGDPHGNEARLQIRCLGALELAVDGAQIAVADIRRKRVPTLLGILLVSHDRPQCKDALIELLWPGADPDVRKRQFHVLVHELRKLLEPDSHGRWQYVRNQGDRYMFDTRSSCWIDTLQFDTQIELGRKAEAARDQQAAIAAYEAAARLYRGDYLQDESAAEWCWQPREQFRERCLVVLHRLAALWGSLGHWDRSIAWLRNALAIDPLREEVHRALMYALWACGRRDAAVRQYEVCAHLLRERLDLAPLPETQQLFARVRAFPRPHAGH